MFDMFSDKPGSERQVFSVAEIRDVPRKREVIRVTYKLSPTADERMSSTLCRCFARICRTLILE